MRYYTGIGSRETPDYIQELMFQIARKLYKQGWILRSGGANGADAAFQSAVPPGDKREIFLPWDGFNDLYADTSDGIYALDRIEHRDVAQQLAAITHPAWDKLKQGAKKLHTRNVFQVLGQDCQTPSKMLVCYAEPQSKEGEVKGGTGTAVKLALQRDIPVFNLYYERVQEKLKRFVEE